ncbi:preprotein translocase subunit YajC [Candidatus Bartonella washoeensis]|uniref:Sec translocon accessory complex subunit YajC n=1 Tax=Cardidatus Bartonella washoeensis 085-0475 TaxID=1094564 RepID=J0QRF7_9HYPH|nr:preprotein translocase subunit YajC [Bartonella washoeensis]EJF85649.1 preprotein translocase, YajC subunit [Bartonella washoeensis 085-0475]
MFITNAHAQVAGGVSNGTSLVTFVPFILIFGIMYFFIIRPQRVQMKKRQEMLNAVRRGDTVITGGGVIGKVTKVYDEIGELEVEICDGMRIRVIRSTLSDVRVKGEPVSEEKTKLNAKTKTPQKSKVVTKKNVDKEKKAVSKESRS